MKKISQYIFKLSISFLIILFAQRLYAQTELDNCNIIWNSPSRNSGESMPCGGGDVGLNVWVEDGDLLVYLARSGAFDENNVFPKLGRLRVTLSPDPFAEDRGGATFRQGPKPPYGYVEVVG